MQTLNRIDWKRGMEIVPETFISTDSYHDSVGMINRHMMVPIAYGLVPLHDFKLEYVIRDRKLAIEKVAATIMDCDGRLMQLSNGTEIPLPKDAQGIYYLTVSPGADKHKEENGVPYLEKEYNYQIINLLNPYSPSLFPILKLHAGHGEWEVLDFIPPCCTVNAHSELINLTSQCRQWLRKILSAAEKQDLKESCYHIGCQLIEMTNSMHGDTASILISRLKKTVFILKTYHLLDEADEELTAKAEEFIWCEFNPNTLFETLQDALSFLHSAYAFLERATPAPTPVEKPKPEPEEEEFTYML